MEIDPRHTEPLLGVHILSDDPAIGRAVLDYASERGLRCREHDSVAAFAAVANVSEPGCIVVGSRIVSEDPHELLAVTGPLLPVIVMTEQADMPSVVRMMQQGVVSVLGRSCSSQELADAMGRALRLSELRSRVHDRFETVNSAVERLSIREKSVLQAIVAGELNKSIASSLDVSIRTIEGDRAKIVNKFGAKSTSEVVGQYAEYRLLSEIGYPAIGLRGATLAVV